MYHHFRTNKHGGGVSILVKQTIAANNVDFMYPDDAEFDLCCIDLQLFNVFYRLICVYRPPGVLSVHRLDSARLSTCIGKLIIPKRIIFVGGDLNLPKINWEAKIAPDDGVHDVLMNLFITNCLHQIVKMPTRLNNILDIFLTSVPTLVSDCSLCDPLGASDHDSVLLELSIPSGNTTPNGNGPLAKVPIILWNSVSIAKAQDYLFAFNWSTVIDIGCPPDIVWSNFCKTLQNCIRMFARIVYVRKPHRKKPIHDDLLKCLFSKKASIWRKLRDTEKDTIRARSLRSHYKAICIRINKNVLLARLNNETKVVNNGDLKQFYVYVNSVLHTPHTTVTLKSDNGNLITDSFAKASMFNNCFYSSFTKDNNTIPIVQNPIIPTCHISNILFSPMAVLSQVRKLKNSRTITPDGFSAHAIKTLGPSLIYPLSMLFEFLFSHNYVPPSWKLSYLTPVHKKSSRSDCNNYRPIAITSILCRLMERIIHDQITAYLFTNNLLTPSQHGFRTGKSSTTNLLESVTDWIFSIDSRNNIDVLYIDLSKAFDSVVHSKLLFKLGWFGIKDTLLLWLTSYLTNRHQLTVVDGIHSLPLQVISGVPQGSVLGPLLFLMFINDLPCQIATTNHPVKLFADDIKIYSVVNTILDALTFQLLINSIDDWCNIWQLKINVSKSLILHLGSSTPIIVTTYLDCPS